MSNCIVCNKDTAQYNILINVSGLYPPRDEMDVLVLVCPECGTMKLVGADADHMKLLATGYPEPTPEDVAEIDIDVILDQTELPNIFHGEKKVWLNAEFTDRQREDEYQRDFGGGYPYINPEYNRLIHFLRMDKAERDTNYGPIQMPAARYHVGGYLSFSGGYHRFCLFRFLGATRIPVAMTQESIDIVKASDIPIYSSKTGD
jgi:hypothetical protein